MKLGTLAHFGIRIGGVVVILLGLALWTGRADELKDIHKLFGIIVVVSLWTLAFVAARAGVPMPFVVGAIIWGLIQPVLGLTQENILTGGDHWVIQVVHLLIGLGVIGWGERLAILIKLAKRTAGAPA